MKKWYALVSGIMAVCLIISTACVPSKNSDSEGSSSGIESSEIMNNSSSDTNKEENEGSNSSSNKQENDSSENEGNSSSGNASSENSGPSGNKLPNVIGTTNKPETKPETDTVPGEEEKTEGEETLPDSEAGEEEIELLPNQILPKDYPYNSASFSNDIGVDLGTYLAFKKTYLSCDGKKIEITQGHKTSSATAALNFIDFEASGAVAMQVKVDATEQTETSLIKFLLKAGKAAELKSGGVYYLIDGEGRIFKYTHSSNRSCSIPAGFSGYVILPFTEYVYMSGQTAIKTEDISQIQIQFQAVETDVNKKMTFSEFKLAYVFEGGEDEEYNQSYVSMSAIDKSNYPYKNSSAVVVDALDENDGITAIGGFSPSQARTYEGRLRLRQTHSNNSCGANLNMKYSSSGYTAVYIEVDNTENGVSWLKFLTNTSSGYAEMKKGATAYLISKYGEYYSYRNTNDTTAICIPAGFKGEVVIPFDSFCYVSDGKNISNNDVIGLAIVLKSVAFSTVNNIYLDNFGYIVGSLEANQIVETDYELSGYESVLINDLDSGNVNISSWNGITSDSYGIENGRLKVNCAHTASSATVAVSYGGNPSQKKAISFDIDATEMNGASYLTILLPTNQYSYSWIVDGGYYYLYSEGKYYKYNHGSYHSVMIPKGFKGKVILPFVQYVYNGTQRRIDPVTLSGSMYIQFQNVGKDATKSLYFDNFEYINRETPSGELVPVPMGGGGYVTGVYIHPLDNDIKYIRTDVGGAYRWDPYNNKWEQMITFTHEKSQLYAVDGLALDPNDVNVLYACLGNGGGTPVQDRGVYKSTDGGKTWSKLIHVNYFGNGAYRQIGECIVVDPNNSNVVYTGTRLNGLHYSRDGGMSWTGVPSSTIPFNSSSNVGLRSIAIDPREKIDGRSKTIYVSGPGVGVYCSNDGGNSWSKISSLPDSARYLKTATDGTLYVSSNDGLFKYKNGSVTNISPRSHTYYSALDVDPTNPNRIITAYSADGGKDPMGLPMFLSEDGGTTWKNINQSYRKIDKRGWWESYYFSSATACLKFNPHNLDEVWMTDWYGVWVVSDVDETKTDWYLKVRGHEEAVIADKVSLPEGPIRFIIGTHDNGSLFYKDITEPPKSRILGDTPDIVYCYNQPNFVVYGSTGSKIHVSYDYGETTTAVTSGVANAMDVVVSATNIQNIVVAGFGTVPFYTKDGGATWHQSTGATPNTMTNKWSEQDLLEADGANGNVIYYSGKEGLYRSDNGGETFTLVNTTIQNFARVRPVPGKEGKLFAVYGGQIYTSDDYGNTFTLLSGMSNVSSISFGKGNSANELAFYALGVYNGVRGLYISDDYGATWEMMIESKDMRCFGAILGDMQVYGACYLSSGGEGAAIVYK